MSDFGANCTNCRSYRRNNPLDQTSAGSCHAIPPAVVGLGIRQNAVGQQEPIIVYVWPIVGAKDWCAKHTPKMDA